jgi:NAD(P)H-hydrate epimerase
VVVKAYTTAQIRSAEAPLLATGVPLMARASAGLATETAALLQQRGRARTDATAGADHGVRGARVLVLAGAGDNGGDALHAAALLGADGATVTVAPTASRIHQPGLAAALAAGASVLPAGASVAEIAGVAAASDVILDGIVGIGSSGSAGLRGRARDIVAGILPVLQESGAPAVVAVDIPSGIGPDDGAVPDPAVLPADLTVTFGGCKAGLLREPAARLAGRIVVVDIGITAALEGAVDATAVPGR